MNTNHANINMEAAASDFQRRFHISVDDSETNRSNVSIHNILLRENGITTQVRSIQDYLIFLHSKAVNLKAALLEYTYMYIFVHKLFYLTFILQISSAIASILAIVMIVPTP